MHARTALAILVVLFTVWCAVFVSKTPYRESGTLRFQGGAAASDIGAPDERQHANYINHLLTERSFPVFRPGSPDLGETYQSHQPPLYYVLAAGWAKVTGADPSEPSGQRIRFLNLFIGIGTLFGIFCAAKWGLDNEYIGLAAVAFAGLMPMFIALHSAIGNDPLLFLICTWTVALCAKALRKGWNLKLAIAIGVLAGLGLLTKTSALALFPTIVIALSVSYFWGENRPCAKMWVAGLLLPLLVGLPWMARNQDIYGDPFAVGAFKDAFEGSPKPQHVAFDTAILENDPVYNKAAVSAIADLGLEPGAQMTPAQQKQVLDSVYDEVGFTFAVHNNYWVNWVGWWTARSYFGVFGYMDVFLFEKQMLERGEDSLAISNIVYRLLTFAAFVLFVGWLLSLRRIDDSPAKAMHVVNGCLLLVVIVLFIRFNLQYFQGQARYLYPAVAPISIGLAAGLCHWMRSHQGSAWMVTAAALTVLDVFAVIAITQGFPERL